MSKRPEQATRGAYVELSEQRVPEYQAVLIVEYDDGRMYPLVDENAPKCLLPVANRKLLAYQLDMIAKSGVVEVYIVAPADYSVSLSHFLSDYVIRDSLTIEKIFVEKDKFDSADALRAVSDRIRGDFICINSDVFSRFSLGDLCNLHRVRQSDLTMMLVAAPIDEPEKKGGKRKLRVEEEDQEYIGVCEDGRVVLKLPVTDAEEAVEISKPLLHRCGSLALRSDLLDMGVYVMSKWMLEHIAENRAMQNVRTEALPFFISRQFQPVPYLLETFPSLQHKRRTLAALEPWLASTASFQHAADGQQFDLVDCLARDLLLSPSADTCRPASSSGSPPPSPRPFGKMGMARPVGSAFDRTDSMQSASSDAFAPGFSQYEAPLLGSGLVRVPSLPAPGAGGAQAQKGGKRGGQSDPLAPLDLVRCYAYVYDRPVPLVSASAQTIFNTVRSGGQYTIPDAAAPTPAPASSAANASASASLEPLLLQRVTNIQSYMSLNRDITMHTHSPATPWVRLTGYRKKEQSMVGEHSVLGVAGLKDGGAGAKEKDGASGSSATAASAGASQAVAPGSSSSAASSAGAASAAGAAVDSTVTLKGSTIGHGVQIGARSKINNSIIMDNVIVGENVTLQNSVVCSGAVIESKSNLNECYVGSGFRVPAETRIKNESFAM